MFEALEHFLRIDSRMSAANIMRARAIYITALMVTLTQIANQIAIYFTVGHFHTTHIVSIAACFAAISLGLILRWTKNFPVLTAVWSLVLILGVVSAALPFGRLGPDDGINTSMLPILICGTVMCAMMCNWRAPFYFMAPALAVVWTFYGLSMTYTQPDFIVTETVALINFTRAFQASLALCVSGVIASYFSFRMFALFDELEENARAARKAEGLTSAYLANMSHEIRTPLNGIIGLSGLLVDEDMDATHKRHINIIKDCGDGLLRIINDVLDLSKLDAGKFTLTPEPFDLRRLTSSLTELHGIQARAKGLTMTLNYDDAMPSEFIGDEGRLRQVLNNLLGNAVKFTAAGAIHLVIKGHKAQGNLYTVKFLVRDSGVGIAPADVPKVFERFEQIDAGRRLTAKDSSTGSGLGLSITKELVDYMGGSIRVQSREGTGTVFGIVLPLPIASDSDAEAEDAVTEDKQAGDAEAAIA